MVQWPAEIGCWSSILIKRDCLGIGTLGIGTTCQQVYGHHSSLGICPFLIGCLAVWDARFPVGLGVGSSLLEQMS
jgi:hypothetical protein